MSSNFDFLKTVWTFLHAWAKESEAHAITAPVTSAFYARLCLEETDNCYLVTNFNFKNIQVT